MKRRGVEAFFLGAGEILLPHGRDAGGLGIQCLPTTPPTPHVMFPGSAGWSFLECILSAQIRPQGSGGKSSEASGKISGYARNVIRRFGIIVLRAVSAPPPEYGFGNLPAASLDWDADRCARLRPMTSGGRLGLVSEQSRQALKLTSKAWFSRNPHRAWSFFATHQPDGKLPRYGETLLRTGRRHARN